MHTERSKTFLKLGIPIFDKLCIIIIDCIYVSVALAYITTSGILSKRFSTKRFPMINIVIINHLLESCILERLECASYIHTTHKSYKLMRDAA